MGETTYERTKRSLFNHLGFLGLNFMNLLNRTWATGAMPLGASQPKIPPISRGFESARSSTHMGAPGCPELLWKVASTWRTALLVTGFHSLPPACARLMIKCLSHGRVSVFRGGDRSRQAIMAGQTSRSRSSGWRGRAQHTASRRMVLMATWSISL